ncbi:MAG: helix-turn-helix domain-containing protein [Nitrospiraceae bacterium]
MNGKPVAIPSLDTLLSDPSQIDGLPLDVLKGLWVDVRNLEKVLVVRMLMTPTQNTSKSDAPQTERWLSTEEAAKLFGLKERWLKTHKDKLPHSKPSHKVLLFPEQKLRSWLAAHKAH